MAPNPKVSRQKLEDAKKRDRKCATIDADLEYKKFLDELENPIKPAIVPLEQRIKEIEMKEKNALENAVQETPLTQYMVRKSGEKFRRIQEKRRTREEERRARLQRLYEKEQRERAERSETKRITEFRNSKFERAALKERSNDRDRERKDRDRGAGGGKKDREDRSEEREVPLRKTDRVLKSERLAKKDRNDTFDSKEGSGRVERIPEKSEHTDNDVKTEEVKSTNEKREKETEANDNEEAKTTMTRPSRTVVSRGAAPKETSEKSDKEPEKSEPVAPKQPRRAKDRPERAIYQPGALRRRAAAAAAAAAAGSATAANANKTDSEKP
ncbi:unnamed protein product [Toxocara canis]|uniref:UPF3 domain-containing protein n=1 Tax=Toxocara canis TaxID=6265 RepID=A0A3P7H8L2_TOXCA|nr:unnamed protein product [Toxocara canis]